MFYISSDYIKGLVGSDLKEEEEPKPVMDQLISYIFLGGLGSVVLGIGYICLKLALL